MRRVAKTINAEPPRVPRFAIGAITDQAGAKQRRNLDIIVTVRQMEAEPCIGDSEFSVTAVYGVASETCVVAEILPV